MDRSNHYEAAFEAYLQWHRLCYVAVDETRRSMLGEERIKSLDFIVYGEHGARLLVDVKGRRFPSGIKHPRRVWECWSTQDDIKGLERWATLFGTGYQGLLVFAYQVLPLVELPEDTDDLWTWHGRRYLLRAIAAAGGQRPPRIVAVPAGLLMALAGILRYIPFLPRVRPAEIRRLMEDKSFDLRAMVAMLGFTPMSLRSGLARTLTDRS